MEQKINKSEFEKNYLPQTKKDTFKLIIVILIVVTLGLLFINQFLSLRYKAELLSKPCDLCFDLNKDLVCKRVVPINTSYDYSSNNISITSP